MSAAKIAPAAPKRRDAPQNASSSSPTILMPTAFPPARTVWRRFTGAMPSAELRLIRNAGHMPWWDDAVGVAALVRRFLEPIPDGHLIGRVAGEGGQPLVFVVGCGGIEEPSWIGLRGLPKACWRARRIYH